MSAINNQNPVNLKPQAVPPSQNNQKKQTQPVDPLLIAFLEINKSVQINHETAGVQAKEIQQNAVAQNNVIDKEQFLNFSTITKSQIDKITKSKRQSYLETLNTHNEEISALRNNLGDQMTVLKQNAQLSETNVNTVMSATQQSVTQGSSLMQMLATLTNQINRG